MENELQILPCPYCACENAYLEEPAPGRFYVFCANCDAAGAGNENQNDAIAKWNMVAQPVQAIHEQSAKFSVLFAYSQGDLSIGQAKTLLNCTYPDIHKTAQVMVECAEDMWKRYRALNPPAMPTLPDDLPEN